MLGIWEDDVAVVVGWGWAGIRGSGGSFQPCASVSDPYSSSLAPPSSLFPSSSSPC